MPYKISKATYKDFGESITKYKGKELIDFIYAFVEEDFRQQEVINEDYIKLYPAKIKNPIKELDKVIKSIAKTRKKHKGAESNAECMDIDCIVEIMSKMSLADFRKLNLEGIIAAK